MPRSKVSNTQLAHEVVEQASEPLTVDQIIERVNAITPITTKNPKQTIRNALNQSEVMVSLNDGRYGWKPRLITGSVLRHTFDEEELEEELLIWDADLQDALWPSFFATNKYRDVDPVHLELPDGTIVQVPLEFLGDGIWGAHVSQAFWDWLRGHSPQPGDYLIVRVVDGEAKRYAVEFQADDEIDDDTENVIVARNEEVAAAILSIFERQATPFIREIATKLLVNGHYRHPIPPDPISFLLNEYVMPDVEEIFHQLSEALPEELLSQLQEAFPMDTLGEAFFGAAAQLYDADQPPDLPREYDPERGLRRVRPSALGKKDNVKSYLLRVHHRALPKVWRDIELAEDQTLEDLHLTIQKTYNWSDDHLYSFYMSGESFDPNTEIGSPWSESALHTHQVTIGQLDLVEGQTFLYLFDYGDNHEFDVTVRAINPSAPKGNYPKVVESHGKAPPQYPDIDEKTGKMSWDPYRHWG
jgi:hypothetical protein